MNMVKPPSPPESSREDRIQSNPVRLGARLKLTRQTRGLTLKALAQAAEIVSGGGGANLKKRMRTGTVVTTDDRNWELRYTDSAKRFSLSRAIGIDMESATISAQGYRFRVPYGTLLCVSDKPLHGELKLPGQANRFYEEAIASHLKIGLITCDLLREQGDRLHSRKLRAFNEPPFR